MLNVFSNSAWRTAPVCLLTKRFREDESGATAIEYSLIVALIFLAILGAAKGFGDSSNEMYTNIETEITNAMN